MKVDEDAGACALQRAGIQDVDGAENAVYRFDVAGSHLSEQLGGRHQLKALIGANETLEGIDIETPIGQTSEDRLKRRFKCERRIGRGPGAISFAHKIGENAFRCHVGVPGRSFQPVHVNAKAFRAG